MTRPGIEPRSCGTINKHSVSIYNWNYVTFDVTIPLVIHIMFSMIIK